MNKIIPIAIVIGVILIIKSSLTNRAYPYSSGAPLASGSSGFTGSPIDNGRTCSTVGCHIGSSVKEKQGWITSNVPMSGYMADSVYTFTINVTDQNANRFGFMATVLNEKGNYSGAIFSSTNNEIQVIGGNKYVTHTLNGTGQNGAKSWSFNWIPPTSDNTESVTVYAAINAANGNGSPSGDQIYLTSLEIQGVKPIDELLVYPNPFTNEIKFVSSIESDKALPIEVINTLGQVVYSAEEKLELNQEYQIDLPGLPSGIYYLRIVDDAEINQKKLIKNKE